MEQASAPTAATIIPENVPQWSQFNNMNTVKSSARGLDNSAIRVLHPSLVNSAIIPTATIRPISNMMNSNKKQSLARAHAREAVKKFT